jgi:hypothetical protein
MGIVVHANKGAIHAMYMMDRVRKNALRNARIVTKKIIASARTARSLIKILVNVSP